MERRTASQNALLHALIGGYVRRFPGIDANEWKGILAVWFPLFLAEADGQPIPEPDEPESTSAMTAARCNEFIEFVLWLGSQIGVQFRNGD